MSVCVREPPFFIVRVRAPRDQHPAAGQDADKINARGKEGFLWESTVQHLDLLRSKKVAAKLSAGDAPPLLGQGTYI